MPNVTLANTTLRMVLDERGTPGTFDVPYFVVGGVASCGIAATERLDQLFTYWKQSAGAPRKATRWKSELFPQFAELLMKSNAKPFSTHFHLSRENTTTIEQHVRGLIDARIASGRPAEPDLNVSVRNWLWNHFVTTTLGVNLFSVSRAFGRIRAVEFVVGKYSMGDWERSLLERSLKDVTGQSMVAQVPRTLSRLGLPDEVVVVWTNRVRRHAAWDIPTIRLGTPGDQVSLADAYCALVGRFLEGDANACKAIDILKQEFRAGQSAPERLIFDATGDFLRLANDGWPTQGIMSTD